MQKIAGRQAARGRSCVLCWLYSAPLRRSSSVTVRDKNNDAYAVKKMGANEKRGEHTAGILVVYRLRLEAWSQGLQACNFAERDRLLEQSMEGSMTGKGQAG